MYTMFIKRDDLMLGVKYRKRDLCFDFYNDD